MPSVDDRRWATKVRVAMLDTMANDFDPAAFVGVDKYHDSALLMLLRQRRSSRVIFSQVVHGHEQTARLSFCCAMTPPCRCYSARSCDAC